MHICIYMTKIISLSDNAYAEMKSLKESGESFSDVVLKMVNKVRRRPLLYFFGRWPGSKEEAKAIKKRLEFERSQFRTRAVNF